MTKTDSILLSLSLLSSLPTFLISLLFSPRRSSFVSSSRRKQKRRKECRKSVVLRDTKFRSDPFRSMEDSAQGLFENEKEREREREKGSKEARACAQAYRRLKRGDASEREMGTVGRQGTSVRNENGSLHLLEEQRRPRLLHGSHPSFRWGRTSSVFNLCLLAREDAASLPPLFTPRDEGNLRPLFPRSRLMFSISPNLTADLALPSRSMIIEREREREGEARRSEAMAVRRFSFLFPFSSSSSSSFFFFYRPRLFE